jgi:hypothetical protein
MSLKSASTRTKNKALTSNSDASPLGTTPKIRVQVELRAYEMYELRSREHGSAEQDWLRAEAEVLSQLE